MPVIYDLELYEKSAQQLLDDAVDAIDPTGLTGGVARRLVEGGAASALLAASKDAALVVVGARGVGGFLGLLIGSVSTQVTHHASCPVVVVPV
jgi:nucleotide-binding universal stress UspA family protein